MQKRNFGKIDIVLSVVAIVLLVSIFLKAIWDMDTNYDVGWYHLPFAARIWGIIPKEIFVSGAKVEHRYDGFPLLAHFLQGLFWKVTGTVQATHLVSYLSVIIYLFFLRSYFKVPLHISTIAIFTIPAVLTHAPGGFVDLPGNIATSVLVMMTYTFFRCDRLPKRNELLTAFLGAAAAANIKPQLQPIVFVIWLLLGIRLIWLYFRHSNPNKHQLWRNAVLIAIASSLIFATPIKNVTLYGNPFYPIKIEVAGVVLNHKMTPETYSEGDRPQKWLRSIFEVNTPEWSVDQSNRTNNKKYLDRAGGFFGAYVAFNLFLLLVLSIKEQYEKRKLHIHGHNNAISALISIFILSFVNANFPQSHELRYLVFWMIVLVSFNLYLLFSEDIIANKWLNITFSKSLYLSFFIIMCINIKSFYLLPDRRSLSIYLDTVINQNILNQISLDKENCAVSRHKSDLNSEESIPIQNIFYYNSYFHPEIESNYTIRVVDEPKKCGASNIIPRTAK